MRPTISPCSSFLFATPSWREAGRLLDLGSTFDDYNRSHVPDATALRMDWLAVSAALWAAFAKHSAQGERSVPLHHA